MFKLVSSKHRLLLFTLLLCGCANQPEKADQNPSRAKLNPPPTTPPVIDSRVFVSVGGYSATHVSGDFANYPALNQFIDSMVQKHGFNRDYLNGLFSNAKRKQWTLDYLAKSDQHLKGKPAQGGWSKYRAQFLDDIIKNTECRLNTFWELWRWKLPLVVSSAITAFLMP